MRGNWITGPAALAAIVTVTNAAKPVLVDDTAYLTYARHIAACPLDPYGFEMFWYSTPQPAMSVLCPPVVPYWLAAGIALFGEHPAALKLWLFPFVWLFAWSLRDLLRRFARGTERAVLPLVVLSPAILPMVNVMLDVPAIALGLAAVVLTLRAADRGGDWRAIAAGVVAALAMQTKYTALLVPGVIGWYGLTHRRFRLAGVAVASAVAVFAGWEFLLSQKYGDSHFVYHLTRQAEPEPGQSWFAGFVQDKFALVAPLSAHLGCLGVGIGLFAGRAVGFPRTLMGASAGVWVIGVGLIALLPYHDTILLSGREPGHEKLSIASTVWRTTGTVVLLTAGACAAILLARRSPRWGFRRSADSWFVVGWVVIELVGYLVLTPFPAARRVIGVTVALGILAARVVSRVNRTRPARRPPGWVVPFGVSVGIGVAALDLFDAYPEKVCAERAIAVMRQQTPTAKGWYTGHWGFQYYCERAGLSPAYKGGPVLAAGDYLVLTVYPDEIGFFRPDSVNAAESPPPDMVEQVGEPIVWDDWLSAQTIPNFYGGVAPIVGRDHPRLRVVVFRLTKPWAIGGE